MATTCIDTISEEASFTCIVHNCCPHFNGSIKARFQSKILVAAGVRDSSSLLCGLLECRNCSIKRQGVEKWMILLCSECTPGAEKRLRRRRWAHELQLEVLSLSPFVALCTDFLSATIPSAPWARITLSGRLQVCPSSFSFTVNSAGFSVVCNNERRLLLNDWNWRALLAVWRLPSFGSQREMHRVRKCVPLAFPFASAANWSLHCCTFNTIKWQYRCALGSPSSSFHCCSPLSFTLLGDTHWRGWSIYLVSKPQRQWARAFGNMQIDTTKVYDFLIVFAIELSIIGFHF